MDSALNVQVDSFLTKMESAAKSIETVKSLIEMLVFVNNATLDYI